VEAAPGLFCNVLVRLRKQAFSESAVTMSVSNNELGELLIDLGLLSPEQLSDAIVQQQNSGTRLTVVLSDMGLITERQLKDALELQYGVNFVNLSSAPPESEYVRLVPEEIERQYRFVPVSMQGNQFTVAMVDPDDLVAAEAIREHLSSANFKKLVCTADDFEHLMYTTYEAPAEASPELDNEGADENDFSSASPRASQTKLKAHMRNLFESDSDDDLDSMFGKSSDSLPALKESDIQPVQEILKQPKKKSKKAISKKITSLFDDDDDDFGDDDLSSPAAPDTDDSVEFAQVGGDTQLPEEEATGTEAEISEASFKSRPELTAEIEAGESPSQEETMPSNQLLEHILQEAGVPRSKPKKMKPKKKSMQSLFDDDDDDMDFAAESDDTSSAEPTEAIAESVDADPSSAAESFEGLGEPAYSESGADPFDDSLNSESLGSDSYTGGSLTGEDSYSGGLLTGLDSEHDESPSEFDSETAIAANEQGRTAESSKKSAAPKAFRSLFDDEMDEDDLFGSDVEQQTEPVQTEEASNAMQFEEAPDTVADFSEGSTLQNDLEPTLEAEPESLLTGADFDGPPVEPAEEEQESAESLMSAIERPFQSLFDDDEDDEDLFGNQNTLESAEQKFTTDDGQLVPSESLIFSEDSPDAEPQAEEIPEIPSDIESSVADEISPAAEDESIKPAYHASFDDEMDEDSLFASASHPIPEGAPHLRDLLSRFDDSDAAFDALEDSLNQAHPEISESPTQPEAADEQDAELAVSALIAALDEQVPDEEISIPPRHQIHDEQVSEAQDAVSISEQIDSEQQTLTHAEPFEDSPHHESTEPVASLPEVSQEVPAITPPANKPVANPKSKKLRALLMDDDDDFGMADREEIATVSGVSEENTSRAEFDEVLPLDKEDLTPLSNATSELPPVVVSRSAKTMTSGTSPREDGSTPTVSSFDEDVENQQSKAIASLEETLPPPSMSPRTSDPVSNRSQLEVDTSVSMPDTAAELPDALDDVLSSVTNDLIDNVELANLSGNRTEISFLEEIVESELALENQSAAESQPSPEPKPAASSQPMPESVLTAVNPSVTVGATSTAQSPPVVQSPPAVQEPTAIPVAPAAQTAQAEQIAPAPQQVPPAVHNPPPAQVASGASAAAEPVTQPVVAQSSAAQAAPASKDLSVSQAAVEKLNLDPSILNLATQILTQAVNSPCSDVHFEPLADGLALRFMSDGDLLDETILPAQIQGMLILCLKSMAGLDPSVVDRPQDKRFITSSFGDPVEMRITSIPGMHGEMVAVSLKS